MTVVTRVAKRLIIGRPVRSDRAGHTLLPKRLALPIFASDALSSVAYATQEILLVLTLAGTAYLFLAPWLAAGVVLLLVTVVASYRQLVVAYPTGGGDYEVATKNIGRPAGVIVASALLVDYVMTVAVSVSSGVDNIISAEPSLDKHRVLMALGFVALLAAMNLRGLKEAGSAFALPTYAFAVGVAFMIITGLVKAIAGHPPVAESAHYEIIPHSGYGSMGAFALIFFALRAFASGCTALTGVEAIANGVPAFKPPKAKNARTTLLLMGGLAATMFAGITVLAVISKVKIVDSNDTCDLIGFANCQTTPQRTVIAQLASSILGGPHSIGFFYIQTVTALILILAANTAFNGFPLLGSILAQDRNLPRQLHTRGDRLVYSNGVIMLAVVAGALIAIYSADSTRLIQLYIVGVFTSFTLGQTGMVRHWNRALRSERDPQIRSRIQRSRLINTIGASMTGLVLVIVTATKFTKGAYLVLIAMPLLYALMRGINKHYNRVSRELDAPVAGLTLPARNHVVVLVSKLHKPTLRALSYARATRPDTLTALTVSMDDDETRSLLADWERHDLPVPLTIIESPFREVTTPVVDYVRKLREDRPNDVVSVFIPEYVVGHWWEHLLHNQSALRLKGRLLFQPGVMVTSVPWQLASSQLSADAEPTLTPPGFAVKKVAPPEAASVVVTEGSAGPPSAN
ncbi:amino acid/polyamine/organocation transporter (APC superfamily) [Jatrophihabitans sp. GAS493]|uniref:APC family permease n=1 Tax=Jatrophihabitans sp. GAS493 TaxID=1907575 RepID=UPI000BB7A717|nr:APC family permease [Jatrophihabitans sp. GAS493]SOD74078.1 amino acid/polyamine/organocation transporter (APC superfamily) [Jatrophihabitans sp. GAS493]